MPIKAATCPTISLNDKSGVLTWVAASLTCSDFPPLTAATAAAAAAAGRAPFAETTFCMGGGLARTDGAAATGAAAAAGLAGAGAGAGAPGTPSLTLQPHIRQCSSIVAETTNDLRLSVSGSSAECTAWLYADPALQSG